MNVRRMLEGMWADQLEDLAEAEAQRRGRELLAQFLTEKHAAVVKKTKKKGRAAIREVLYHTWAVRFGGELGDKIRDHQEAKVVAAVAARVTDATPKREIAQLVVTAVVELVF